MQYLADYGLFAAKILTLAVVLVAVILVIILAAKQRSSRKKGELLIEKINAQYEDMLENLNALLLSKLDFKKWRKAEQKKTRKKEKKKPSDTTRPRIFVVRFEGDLRAQQVNQLREEITAILQVASPSDEVVVCLNSPGGIVPTYGLGASQLQRLRDQKIPLTVIVDKVAASGGYLMASVADKILAAPFAIIGSIGVLAQLPNFHRLLKKNHIDFEQITAGKYKRTLTVFGENTEADREKMQEDIEEIHTLFKAHIAKHRPQVDVEVVATGEHWLGTRALELKLIDGIATSDDYLWSASKNKDIFSIRYHLKKSLSEKLGATMDSVWDRIIAT